MTGFAQLVTERVLNSLPEGLLIALGAWLLLRIMGRQNAGTRFAVWMVALAGVVALPVLTALGIGSRGLASYGHPEVTIPASWAIAFVVFWSVIGSLVFARVLAGVWQVRQLRRTCREVPVDSLDRELQGILQQTKRPVRLLLSEKARVPAAVGFIRPAVVMPAWALEELTAAELKPILIHELAHLRRHDDWTNLLQKTLRAVFFFHPAIWWIDARLSQERELACDDAVLVATGNPRAYAGCLIDLLERGCVRRGWTMAQALLAHAKDASVRIARILQSGTPKNTRVGRTALGMAATLSLACAGIAACAPGLIGFEPEHTVAAARFVQPISGFRVHPPQSDVIPASFHPEERVSALRKITSRKPVHPTALRRPEARQVAAHPAPPRVEMARLATADRMNRAVGATTLVIFTETGAAANRPDAAVAEGASPAPTELLDLQDSAFQFQVVQIVTRTGSKAGWQVIHLELIVAMPSALPQGIQSHSI